MVGFCEVEVKLFGPNHVKLVPIFVDPDKFMFCPAQTGATLAADAVGTGFTETVASLETAVKEAEAHVACNT